jgi:pyrimidine deaminase RibD-like protein
MMATWDDLEELSEMEEEEANVCLMTKSDNEEVTLEPCSSCIRTEHFCDNLLYDCQITTQKNNELRE